MRGLGFVAGGITALLLVLAGVLAIGPASEAVATAPVAAAEVIPVDTIRAAIHAGDIKAVSAIFAGLSDADRESRGRQRDTFNLMSELHPKVDTFTRDWLRAEPNSADAMTARANFLYAIGFEWRGVDRARDVAPDAMAAFRKAHAEAQRLVQRAITVNPRLLPASDGVIHLAKTAGPREAVVAEVDRIMALVPTRRTLINAASSLAPQWGGSLVVIKGLCDRHAAKVTDQPGYDAAVCWIEGRMAANLWEGPDRDQAYADLAANDSPLLDHWRPDQLTVKGDTPTARLQALAAVKAERPLTIDEARLHDDDAGQVAVLTGQTVVQEYPAAVARTLAVVRGWADGAPGHWDSLRNLFEATELNRQITGEIMDPAEREARLVAYLSMSPYKSDPWRELGIMRLQGLGTGADLLGRHETAEPFLTNAIAYAGAGTHSLQLAFQTKLTVYFDQLQGSTPAADPARFQAVIICPMVRQLRLLLAKCAAKGEPFGVCTGDLPFDEASLQRMITDIRATGICLPEADLAVEALHYSPMAVDLSQ